MRARFRWSGARYPGQGFVEYSLLAATLALLGVAGMNAITLAQREYFVGPNGVEASLQPTPPSAPGALLHPTLTSQPVCRTLDNKTTDVLLVDTDYICEATVTDTLLNPTDLKPPAGEVHFHLGGTLLRTCVMAINPAPGSTSTCSFSWKPTSGQIGRADLRAIYCPVEDTQAPVDCPPKPYALASNHFQSPFSPPLALTIQGDVVFKSVTCVNEIVSSFGPNQTEIGHPINCTVHLTKSNNTTPVAAQEVVWTTENWMHSGLGIFTCGTDPNTAPAGYDKSLIWAGTAPCWQPAIETARPTATACTTAADGKCAVLYRALYNSSGASSGAHVLGLSATGQNVTSTKNVTINTPLAGQFHPTLTVGRCEQASANVQVLNPSTPTVFHPRTLPLSFHTTDKITINGGSPGQLSCTVHVVDIDPTIALEDLASTNKADAYPPMGRAEFVLDDGTNAQVVGTCNLVMVAFPAPPTQQARGQAPYMSSCTTNLQLTKPAGPSTAQLYLAYAGEQGPAAGHKPPASAFKDWIPVEFVP